MRIAFKSTWRFLQILRVLARFGVGHLVGRTSHVSRPWVARRFPMAGEDGPTRLRMFFEELGGTFVKFGQMLALQPDILSIAYCNALFKLLDRVEPFPYSEAERILREELGAGPEEIFDSIDAKPLATASVGQVHVAWLAGQKVAVKVQRPNVETEFKSDVHLMVGTMWMIRTFRLGFLSWLLEPMGEFVGWTEEELDYRNEARYSEQLRAFAHDNPVQYVPKVHLEHTTRRVLVVEFLDGVSLLDYLRARDEGNEVLLRRLESKGFDRKRFAANVIDNFLGDAFRHGLYHADLHPANLMILDDSVVGYIDFGITGVMSRYSRQHLILMTQALAEGDMDTLYTQFLKLSRLSKHSNPEAFRADLENLTADWYDELGPHKRRLRVSFTRVMTEMLHLSRRTGVMPERDIIKYIRSAIAIDGLNSRFEPDFHVGQHLQEVCGRYLQWRKFQSVMTHENLVAWSTSSARVVRDSPRRFGRFLDGLLRGELPIGIEFEDESSKHEGLRSRALHLATVILIVAVLTGFGDGSQGELGWNLFTAQLTLIGAGFLGLIGVLWKLA